MRKINYTLFGMAQQHYEQEGFHPVEVPWMVTSEVSNITKPFGIESNIVANKKKELVASGEQSFLYQYLKGYLPKGTYQTVTPCFRNEPYDLTHSKQFMKLELIDTGMPDEISLDMMVKSSFKFFKSIMPKKLHEHLKIVETGSKMFDIELGGYELGSYGIRECEFLKWIYGTGIAEPRFSQVVSILDKFPEKVLLNEIKNAMQ